MGEAAQTSREVTIVDARMARKLSGDAVSSMIATNSGGEMMRVGDTAILDPNLSPQPGWPVLVKLQDGSHILGVYHPAAFDGKKFTIEPLNERYPAFTVPDEARAKIVAVVAGVIRPTIPII